MRNILLLPLLVISTSLYSQEIPFKDGEYIYEEIVTLDSSYSKDVIFTNAKSTLVNLYKNTNNGIQQEDKEAGKLIVKAYTTVKQTWMLVTYYHEVHYAIDLTVKDGRYRIQLHHIDIKPVTGNTMAKRTIDEIKAQGEKGAMKKFNKELLLLVDNEMKANIASLKKGIEKKSNNEF